MLFAILLGVGLAVGFGYMLQSLAEEKESRLVEVVVTSASPLAIIGGKLLAPHDCRPVAGGGVGADGGPDSPGDVVGGGWAASELLGLGGHVADHSAGASSPDTC